MATDLLLSFYTHPDTGRVHMTIAGPGARGGKFRKEMEFRHDHPIALEAMQEFLADCSYEARNMIPGPPDGYFVPTYHTRDRFFSSEPEGPITVVDPTIPEGGRDNLAAKGVEREKRVGWSPSIYKDPGEAT